MKEFYNCIKLNLSKLLLHAKKQKVAFEIHNITAM